MSIKPTDGLTPSVNLYSKCDVLSSFSVICLMRLSLMVMTNRLSRVAPFKGMTNHLHLFISSQCCFLSSNSSTSTEDYPVHVVLYM